MCESYNFFVKLCNTYSPQSTQLCALGLTLTLKNNMMTNVTEVKGNWNEQKGKLKQKFAILTDNDLMFADGKKEEMFGRLQVTLGKTKDQLRAIISSL